ncbi:MAG: TonB family protein [Candidatus Sulfotelmatobacter sp.]|jgi:TonB family protein
MSTPVELWKNWEGRLVDGKFPLRQWLGGSGHSAVFLTERDGPDPQSRDALKAVIKLIPAPLSDADAQLARWEIAAKLSHPNLMQLFGGGRCHIEDTEILYLVMEYADENLAQILPLRPLAPEEAEQMLPPTAEALAFLHQSGFVHGHLKPSNIMAANDRLKISSDGLRKSGEPRFPSQPNPYDAPEVNAGLSPAADLWSLGMTLLAVMTQQEPELNQNQRDPVVPETLPQPFREIASRCLLADPLQRCSAPEILNRLHGQPVPRASAPPEKPVQTYAPSETAREAGAKRKLVVPAMVAIVIVVILALVAGKFMGRRPETPSAETHSAPAEPAPNSASTATNEAAKGAVLQQVLPDVSPSAQSTIKGRIKVSVRVLVDPSGKVTEAKLTSGGPSRYFAGQALSAARRWTFNPPQVDGQKKNSEWLLRFQFARSSIEVFPKEINR